MEVLGGSLWVCPVCRAEGGGQPGVSCSPVPSGIAFSRLSGADPGISSAGEGALSAAGGTRGALEGLWELGGAGHPHPGATGAPRCHPGHPNPTACARGSAGKGERPWIPFRGAEGWCEGRGCFPGLGVIGTSVLLSFLRPPSPAPAGQCGSGAGEPREEQSSEPGSRKESRGSFSAWPGAASPALPFPHAPARR